VSLVPKEDLALPSRIEYKIVLLPVF
jgi:hypothetical protein